MDGGRRLNHFLSNDQVALLKEHKTVVCSLSASYISTLVGYPLDSLKARLQTHKGRSVSVPRLAALVYREEGVGGFFRGLWIPLVTISFVRAASFTIYTSTKDLLRKNGMFVHDNWRDAALMGGIAGATSGALVTMGTVPFELVKIRRQLEYTIAASQNRTIIKPPSSMVAVSDIVKANGVFGLYTGFRLHALRDTLGTSLYFMEYDAFRSLLGRSPSGEQGPKPHWLPVHQSLVPFLCGSVAGVSSWALIYPLDVVKTKVQQRALAHDVYRGPFETLFRLIRGPDPSIPKPIWEGISRMYRGLSVSALRSITTHGLLWTFFDMTSDFVDSLTPRSERLV